MNIILYLNLNNSYHKSRVLTVGITKDKMRKIDYFFLEKTTLTSTNLRLTGHIDLRDVLWLSLFVDLHDRSSRLVHCLRWFAGVHSRAARTRLL